MDLDFFNDKELIQQVQKSRKYRENVRIYDQEQGLKYLQHKIGSLKVNKIYNVYWSQTALDELGNILAYPSEVKERIYLDSYKRLSYACFDC